MIFYSSDNVSIFTTAVILYMKHKTSRFLCLTVFNAIFNNISVTCTGTFVYRSATVSFIGGGNWRTRRKPLSCRKSLTTLSFELTTSVVIGTDCIGNCKSNYHSINTLVVIQEKQNYHNHMHSKWKNLWNNRRSQFC